MRVLLASEGSLDVGPSGAVTKLVRRVLGAALRRDLAEHEIEETTQTRLHKLDPKNGLEKKLRTTLRVAIARRCDCAVIVIDRDGPKNDARLGHLRAARQAAESSPDGDLRSLATRTAVGVAVETVESWLLFDERGLNAGISPGAAIPRQRDPEKWSADRKPKGRFLALLRLSTRDAGNEVLYAAVADACDPSSLEKDSASFRALANELRERLI